MWAHCSAGSYLWPWEPLERSGLYHGLLSNQIYPWMRYFFPLGFTVPILYNYYADILGLKNSRVPSVTELCRPACLGTKAQSRVGRQGNVPFKAAEWLWEHVCRFLPITSLVASYFYSLEVSELSLPLFLSSCFQKDLPALWLCSSVQSEVRVVLYSYTFSNVHSAFTGTITHYHILSRHTHTWTGTCVYAHTL